jgi:hypothetical protein
MIEQTYLVPADVAESTAAAYTGWMFDFGSGTKTITLKGEHLAEIERLIAWYTECLASHNAIGPGKQCTLDTLNEAWEIIYSAREDN